MKRLMVLLLVALLVCPWVNAQQETGDGPEQAIIDACTYNEPADISAWDLDGPELEALFYELRTTGRLPWYIYHFSYTYRESESKVISFTPKNLDPEIYHRELYEQQLAQVMDACVFDGINPIQIALSVHDWLVLHCAYDLSLEANTGYDLLVNGTTVCAGYAAAYMDILNRLGIPCVTVTSEEMNHAWNLVQLDGQWYHVDVTWDDPTEDIQGRVKHQYFLLTDEEISAGDDPHYGWETDITCTDTRFSNAYWRDVSSPICYESSQISYYVSRSDLTYRLLRREESTGQTTTLYTESKHYVPTGSGRYAYGHFGLCLQGDRLFFGVQNAVLSVSTSGQQLRTELEYDTYGNRKYICGVLVSGSTAQVSLSDHDGNLEYVELPLQNDYPLPHAHAYVQSTTQPDCLTPGYTQWTCSCGLSCQSDPTAPLEHSFEDGHRRAATFFGDGFVEQTCTRCAATQTQVLPQEEFMPWLEENWKKVLMFLALIWFIRKVLKPQKAKT